MLTTVRGIFENGKITLDETPPVNQRMEVIVIFMNEVMSDGFDEPLDDITRTR